MAKSVRLIQESLLKRYISSVKFSSVTQSCLTLCDPMDCSTPVFRVRHQLQELAQTYIHRISDATQPSHMQSTPCEMQGWMKYMLESRLPGEILIKSDMQMTKPHGRKWRGTKKPLDEGERREWKSWLKIQHSKNKDHGIQSHHFMANRWVNNGNSNRLYFLGL